MTSTVVPPEEEGRAAEESIIDILILHWLDGFYRCELENE